MPPVKPWTDDFLADWDPTPASAPEGFPAEFKLAGLFVQRAPNGLEVLLASSAAPPADGLVRKAWLKRRAGRSSPVLLLVGYSREGKNLLAVCGPIGEHPEVYGDIEVSQLQRIARAALSEQSHHAATRFLLATLPGLDTRLPGLRNVGLFASQELRAGVPARPDWKASTAKAVPLLAKRGKDLVQGLGFEVKTLATNASLLSISDPTGGGGVSPEASGSRLFRRERIV